jgi:hypothetical protein
MSMVNRRYGGLLGHALNHIYPDIGFSKKKFNDIFCNSLTSFLLLLFLLFPLLFLTLVQDWHGTRNFLLTFAQNNGFDPLIPENWYSVTLAEIWSHKVILFFLTLSPPSFSFLSLSSSLIYSFCE